MAVPPRIAIIGAGPAGLTLARVLQQNGLHATIYESEKSSNTRSQGGSLDLHAESGMLAMQAMGLVEQFNAVARPEGAQFRVMDKEGHVLFDHRPDVLADPRPEIDRAQLRDILLQSLTEGTIQWGRKLVSVESTETTHTLLFEDGAREGVELVIGADGAWSKVRPLVSRATPVYAGIHFVDCLIHNVDDRFPALAALAGDGLCLAIAPERGLLLQRNSGGRLHIYISVTVEEGWAKQEFRSAPEIRPLLLSFFEGWNPELLEFIHHCDSDSFWPRPIYALPVDHRWTSKRGVTLVGDAAHVMTPCAGEGANIAMLDALQLALALAAAWRASPSVESLCDAIPAFEQTMFQQAHKASHMSAINQALMFNESSPHEFLKVITKIFSGEGPPQ